MGKMVEKLKHFSERKLVRLLFDIPPANVSIFALACASRLINQVKIYTRSRPIDQLLVQANEKAWKSVLNHTTFESHLLQDAILKASPSENEEPDFEASVLEDACAAVVYALRSLADNAPQNAAWAARCAYEATDRFAAQSINEPEYSKSAEYLIIRHPIVQSELERQDRDVEMLSLVFDRERIKMFRSNAMEESVFIPGSSQQLQ